MCVQVEHQLCVLSKQSTTPFPFLILRISYEFKGEWEIVNDWKILHLGYVNKDFLKEKYAYFTLKNCKENVTHHPTPTQ